jgi:hypothetical protein
MARDGNQRHLAVETANSSEREKTPNQIWIRRIVDCYNFTVRSEARLKQHRDGIFALILIRFHS